MKATLLLHLVHRFINVGMVSYILLSLLEVLTLSIKVHQFSWTINTLELHVWATRFPPYVPLTIQY